MSIFRSEFLYHLGWSSFYESQVANFISSSLRPARVIGEEKNLYRIQFGSDQIMWANVTGKMRFGAKSRSDFPAVGDWVLVEVPAQSERGIIHHICERKSCLQRKQAGGISDVQILSANVDFAFIATSLPSDLNFRRLERYLTIVWESGATPVILLTKADLSEGAEDSATRVRDAFPSVSVHCLSQDRFEEATFLAGYLKPGSTSIVIGSSGVGKSTLINYLIGNEQIKTQEVRVSDHKGRHTTTSRELYISRFGGLVIDTPGMRELQFFDHGAGFQIQFEDVDELTRHCRFTNCRHQTEPGCAIIEAISSGSLSTDRWMSHQKLLAEIRYETKKSKKSIKTKYGNKYQRGQQ